VILLSIAAVSGWQYTLLRDFPLATPLTDIIPSPNQKYYATILHYQSRLPFRPTRDFLLIEVGRGRFDQQPEILHSEKIPMDSINLEALGGRPIDGFIRWRSDSSGVQIQVAEKPQLILTAPSESTAD
jgi:hypothetical protein